MTPHSVYRQIDASGRTLYIGASRNPAARYEMHVTQSSWIQQVTSMQIEWYPDKASAFAAERAAIMAEKPPHNLEWQMDRKKHWDPNYGQLFVQEWMRKHNISIYEFARRLGEPVASARKLSTQICQIQTRRSIVVCAVTDGYVPMSAWDRHYMRRQRSRLETPILRIPSAKQAKINLERALERFSNWNRPIPPRVAEHLAATPTPTSRAEA